MDMQNINLFIFMSYFEMSNWLAAFYLLLFDIQQDMSCILSGGNCNFLI
jgi:hypothetical protein